MINDQINIVQSDNDWWVDSGASKHVCKDRSLFKTLVPVEDGKVLYMGFRVWGCRAMNVSSGNAMNVSTYMLVYSISSLWHNRLGPVNYKRL